MFDEEVRNKDVWFMCYGVSKLACNEYQHVGKTNLLCCSTLATHIVTHDDLCQAFPTVVIQLTESGGTLKTGL